MGEVTEYLDFSQQLINTTPQINMRHATVALCVLCLTYPINAAPQERFGLGDIMNGITDIIFGKEYDTPTYEVLAVHDTSKGQFEERRYLGETWWACNQRVISDDSGDNGMFMKLFRYITGDNEGGNKISMTTPVSMQMNKKDANNSFRKEMSSTWTVHTRVILHNRQTQTSISSKCQPLPSSRGKLVAE